MIDKWTILRIIFSLIITLIAIYITQFVSAISEKSCEFAKSLYVSNGKLLSSLLTVVAVINIFMPINKFLSTIPILGSSYVLLFILMLFSLLFILKRIVSNINDPENKKCRVKNYKSLIEFIDARSISEIIFYTFIVSIIFFYL